MSPVPSNRIYIADQGSPTIAPCYRTERICSQEPLYWSHLADKGRSMDIHPNADDTPATSDEDQDIIDDWIDSQRQVTSTQPQTSTHPVVQAPSAPRDP